MNETMNKKERPLVTFALFAYNQEQYIREAVEAALNQDYSPMQIILSDDCSSDGTYHMMLECAKRYSGSNTVVVNRSTNNLGIGAHVNSVMEMADGEMIVVAAGDDVSLPNRVSMLIHRWNSMGQVPDAMASAYYEIDDHSSILRRNDSFQDKYAEPFFMARLGKSVTGCAAAWTSRLWKGFGPLPEDTVNEDRVLTFRALLAGGIGYVDQPLVKRRVGSSTWIAPKSQNVALMKNRYRTLASCNAHVARVALSDASIAERDDLDAMLRARLVETKIIESIHARRIPALSTFASPHIWNVHWKAVTQAFARAFATKAYMSYESRTKS